MGSLNAVKELVIWAVHRRVLTTNKTNNQILPYSNI